ncbi:MAG: hypothetical protein ACRBB0_07335 [Pelagimonas sp.]|uniref:hypothetical protein n=1 Tax=Pelagimonas sp. TaxID=2073170 RepID=UPI003D6A2C0C
MKTVEQAAISAWDNAIDQVEADTRLRRLQNVFETSEAQRETIGGQKAKVVSYLVDLAASTHCGCLVGHAQAALSSPLITKVQSYQIGDETVRDIIANKYSTTIDGLKRDFRRFGLVNLMVLSLLVALVGFKQIFTSKIAAFSVALTAYVGWAVHGYVFNQNWVTTILFRDWTALSYQIGMIFAGLILADWVFLKARVTRLIGNAVSSASPC